MIRLEVDIVTAGYCVHPEKIAIRNGSFRLREFPAMAALIKHPDKGYILFDTGYTQRFFTETATWPLSIYRHITPVYLEKGESVAEQLRSQGIGPEQIRYVILSHFHADHIGGCQDFSQATFIAHQDAYNAVKNLDGIKALRAGFIKNLLPADFENRLVLLADLHAVKLSLEHQPFEYGFDIFDDASLLLVRLSGHTDGHVGLITSCSSTGNYFFIGDACWQKCSYSKLIPPHWLATLITASWQEYTRTLKQIHEYAKCHPEVIVVPSHCSETLEGIVGAAKY